MLEARIAALLRKRLGREATDGELAGYRQVLWAFATFIGSIIDREHAASLTSRLTQTAPTDPCPAPSSTLGSPPKATTGKRRRSSHNSIGR